MDWRCCINSGDSSQAWSDEQLMVCNECRAPIFKQKFKSQQKIAEAQLYIESVVLILKQKV